jgi:hypothetical protein
MISNQPLSLLKLVAGKIPACAGMTLDQDG